MKKLIAILLLFIHFVNTTGQLAIYEYFVYKSNKLFNEQINRNRYNVDDLTEIKVPVNLPGITDWKNYEKLSGRIQFGASAYNYVKIRMTRNAIYLVCIPNYETTHLAETNVIYARQIPDIPVTKKDHVPFGKTNSVDYNYQVMDYKFRIPIITTAIVFCGDHSDAANFNITGPAQPPDSLSNHS